MTIKSLTTIVFSVFSAFYLSFAAAEPFGEENEPSLESLDEPYTEEGAARLAAGFSSEVIEATPADSVKNMSNAADLIFIGNVVEQSYVYDDANLPSTHTTFSVTDILKGGYPAAELTLIQQGGPLLSGDGGFMVSTTRHFNIGEEEVLFVNLDSNNETERNRITIASRFRIHNNHVYNGDGYGVIMGPSGNLTLSYDRHPSKHFKQINMGTHTLTKHHSVDNDGNPDSDGETGRSVQPAGNRKPYANSMDLAAFSALIRE